MEQTQNKISDERLAEYAAWREWDDPDGLQHDATLMAHELTALRASHKRLVEALEEGRSNHSVDNDCVDDDLCAWCEEVEAALADARKLEGK